MSVDISQIYNEYMNMLESLVIFVAEISSTIKYSTDIVWTYVYATAAKVCAQMTTYPHCGLDKPTFRTYSRISPTAELRYRRFMPVIHMQK